MRMVLYRASSGWLSALRLRDAAVDRLDLLLNGFFDELKLFAVGVGRQRRCRSSIQFLTSSPCAPPNRLEPGVKACEVSPPVGFSPEAWSFYDCIRGKNDIPSFENV